MSSASHHCRATNECDGLKVWAHPHVSTFVNRTTLSAVWQFYELEDECRPAGKCKGCKLMVSRGSRNRSYCSTTHSIRHLKKHEAEYKEYWAATKLKAGLKQQTLLTSLRKDKLAVLAVSCNIIWSDAQVDQERLTVLGRLTDNSRYGFAVMWFHLSIFHASFY